MAGRSTPLKQRFTDPLLFGGGGRLACGILTRLRRVGRLGLAA